MTAPEFREAVIAAYRSLTGLEPPGVLVNGDEKAGFTVMFSTTVFGREPSAIVDEFRSAAMVQAVAAAAPAVTVIGRKMTAEELLREQLRATSNPPVDS